MWNILYYQTKLQVPARLLRHNTLTPPHTCILLAYWICSISGASSRQTSLYFCQERFFLLLCKTLSQNSAGLSTNFTANFSLAATVRYSPHVVTLKRNFQKTFGNLYFCICLLFLDISASELEGSLDLAGFWQFLAPSHLQHLATPPAHREKKFHHFFTKNENTSVFFCHRLRVLFHLEVANDTRWRPVSLLRYF